MKFENIKVGDKVYIQYGVGGLGGFHQPTFGRYFLPKEVTKVTPKFFDADGMRFSKESGLEHKSGYGHSVAYNLGDNYCGKEVKDETAAYLDAMEMNDLVSDAQSLMYRYRFDKGNWTSEELKRLIALLEKNKGE